MSEFHLHSDTDTHSHDDDHSANHKHCHHHFDFKKIRESNKKIFTIIMIGTLIFAAIEAVGGIWSGSLALLSDFCHMLTDSASILLALIMSHISQKPADNNHSYGHGRADTLGAFVNSLFMLGIIVFLMYEGIHRLIHPEPVKAIAIILIASLGLFMNLFSFILLKDSHSLNSKAALIHVIGDMLGTIATIIAGVAIYLTHYTVIDPILSLIVSVIMIPTTVRLIMKSMHILMEGVPEHLNYNEIGQSLASIEHVQSVHDLHIWTMISDSISLSAHIRIFHIEDWENILAQCQIMLSEKYQIYHVTLQPEIIERHKIQIVHA
jgi:cobalt-zinc-cadmium efflux system protein